MYRPGRKDSHHARRTGEKFSDAPDLAAHPDSTPAGPPEWVAINDPQKLRAICADTTIRGTAYLGKAQRATRFVGHLRSDGTGVLAINGQRIPRLWEVAGNDQVCATDAKGKNCYRLQRNRNNRNEIKGWNVASSTTVEFTIESAVIPQPEVVQVPVIRASAIGSESPPSQTSQPVALLRSAAQRNLQINRMGASCLRQAPLGCTDSTT
jgi:hypothetical protein